MTVISQSNGCYFAADGQREGCQGAAAAVIENKGGRGCTFRHDTVRGGGEDPSVKSLGMYDWDGGEDHTVCV
ncbi:hypothetical protein E2C01_081702 [Portunus trituberculatus]|uniref:Uncharacterized protein n=1 Tax=Portunus trituberculatus TaxID=210409 RepID=A0A5B7IWK8_PORTR|nr:hypothetical protein [Portunus trituberculatus]